MGADYESHGQSAIPTQLRRESPMLSALAELGSALAGISVFFAVIQLTREMRSENLQSLFYLHQYLAQGDFSAARHIVRTRLHSLPYSEWCEGDRAVANTVCASYDQAGLLISAGILRKETKRLFLRSSWGESICDQYEALSSFLADAQTPNKTGADFFCHFAGLYAEAKQYHRV